MEKVLDDATKMVNFIKQAMFTPDGKKKLYENLDKQHKNLLLCIEIRCLSRGRDLNRVSDLKGELQEYFQENSRPDFAKCFEDEEWLEKLAYLTDTFHHMNQMNKSMQGPRENVLTSSDKILRFKRKLNLWKKKKYNSVKGNLEMFPLLLGLQSEEGYQQLMSLIQNHIEELLNKIKHYFSSLQHKCMTG
jgi:uncharacterized protein YlzI (FlbEa/FlbD family)